MATLGIPLKPRKSALSVEAVYQLYNFDDLTLGSVYVQTAWRKTETSDSHPHHDERVASVNHVITASVDHNVLVLPIDFNGLEWTIYFETLAEEALRHYSAQTLAVMGSRVRASLPLLPPRKPYLLPADSPLEAAFVAWILTQAALPGIVRHVEPQQSVVVNGRTYRVDYELQGSARKIAVELDGYTYHGTREAFTEDRFRQNELALTGRLILRFSYEAVHFETSRCVAQLKDAMRLDPLLRKYIDSAPRLDARHNGSSTC